MYAFFFSASCIFCVVENCDSTELDNPYRDIPHRPRWNSPLLCFVHAVREKYFLRK